MTQTLYFQHGGSIVTVTVARHDEQWHVTVDGRPYTVQAQAGERGRLALEFDGQRVTVHVAAAEQGGCIQLHSQGRVWELERSAGPQPRRVDERAAAGLLTAAMPGRVLDVLVRAQDTVRRGDVLLLLEAMKMELRITAPADGTVQRVDVAPGQTVERGAPLIELG